MPLHALTAEPELFAAVLIGGVVLGLALAAARPRRRFRRRCWRLPRPANQLRIVLNPALRRFVRPLDAADQLRIVVKSNFRTKRVLNASEARVFDELKRAVAARDESWHVMAQVSLGEILRCDDREAFSCINSKRVDLLLVDAECTPRCAIEYQGGAHYQGAAAARDAVKKEAPRRAGISYYEVVAGGTTPAELRRLVEKLVPLEAAEAS